jgi:hypothetical protein
MAHSRRAARRAWPVTTHRMSGEINIDEFLKAFPELLSRYPKVRDR